MWQSYSQEELERQYNARASVADFDAEIARYREMSAEAYATCNVVRDLAYGPAEAERIDYFDAGPNAPVMIFVHGGYWRLLGRADSALFAKTLAAHGISTAIVEYTLAPEASLDQIVAEIRRAVVWTYAEIATYGGDPERLFISGSSAGAHLAAMALATDWSRDFNVPGTVLKGALLLSGLYDLEPVRHCMPNEWLKLDRESAARNSPQNLTFETGPRVHIGWGGHETDEFKRQSRDFLTKLERLGFDVSGEAVPDRNHFDILTDLADPQRPLFAELLSMIRDG